jgi:SpoIID/LytB domain protein
MGFPVAERVTGAVAVLQLTEMRLISSTYHRLGVHSRRPLRMAAIAGCTLAGLTAWAAPAGAASLVIEGTGDGHGVGMSQSGALGYAQHGASYSEILAHYYTGTTLGQAPAKAIVRVLIGGHVVKLPLERYVRGVVSAEMPASWPAAALEAQAVASRTYALTAHAGGSRFDVYADTRSQVFRGASAETPQTNAAVAETAGQIVLYNGAPAATYFFSSSGGMTEDIENAFLGAAPEPWLLAVPDPYDSGHSSSWRLTLSFAAASARLHGLVKGALRGIEVLTRGVSPRIVSAEVLGSNGVTPASGPELAARFGLESTWAFFSVKRGSKVTREPDRSGQTPSASLPTAKRKVAPTTGPQGGSQAPASTETVAATGGSG